MPDRMASSVRSAPSPSLTAGSSPEAFPRAGRCGSEPQKRFKCTEGAPAAAAICSLLSSAGVCSVASAGSSRSLLWEQMRAAQWWRPHAPVTASRSQRLRLLTSWDHALRCPRGGAERPQQECASRLCPSAASYVQGWGRRYSHQGPRQRRQIRVLPTPSPPSWPRAAPREAARAEKMPEDPWVWEECSLDTRCLFPSS